ncbi:hypothetical protein DAPPUDRAFT_268684 [Daphnia pulex]|uniref:Uncharacterized protein n=1 Tax=Daphnia pulex TaxID=6669 RepID=E9HY68_DAPPU|nr:hypothetical protein DAPPUDRAFT_268684 [Daphnia pulex]|eukprot:EFX63310.1 hypothetical protein DAPPUDRAFT_268684 [Daphnia pulex]
MENLMELEINPELEVETNEVPKYSYFCQKCGFLHHPWSMYYALCKNANKTSAVPEDDVSLKLDEEKQEEEDEESNDDDVSSESSPSSAEKQQVKRKNSLQRLEEAKRFKKMEKRGLPTVDSDDDLGDMTDSFSSGCSTYDSDDSDDWTGVSQHALRQDVEHQTTVSFLGASGISNEIAILQPGSSSDAGLEGQA